MNLVFLGLTLHQVSKMRPSHSPVNGEWYVSWYIKLESALMSLRSWDHLTVPDHWYASWEPGLRLHTIKCKLNRESDKVIPFTCRPVLDTLFQCMNTYMLVRCGWPGWKYIFNFVSSGNFVPFPSVSLLDMTTCQVGCMSHEKWFLKAGDVKWNIWRGSAHSFSHWEIKWILKINCKCPSSPWPVINSSCERADVTVSWTIFETGLIFMLMHSSHPCKSCQTPPSFLTADLTTSTSWFSITNG